MEHSAPITADLILSLKRLLERKGLTQDDLRSILNSFLEPSRRIDGGHAGTVQISRWLNPTSRYWPEPRGEIVLAMQLAKKKIEETS